MMGRSALTFLCYLVLVYIVFLCTHCVTAEHPLNCSYDVTPVRGVIGKEYHLTVNKSSEYLFEFSDPVGVSSSSPAHITVESSNVKNDHPILIVLRQAKGVLSWQIPFSVGNTMYMKTSRILCPDVNYYKSQNFSNKKLKYTIKEDNSFYVSISSGSPDDILFRMIVTTLENFTVSVNTEYKVPPTNMSFTPSQPWYYQFKWPENSTLPGGKVSANSMKSVVVKVESNDEICMTMSIQSLSCPVLDLERTVGYEGFRQTLDKKGGVTLTKEQYPNGFHIVFVVNGDDRKCSDKAYFFSDEGIRIKTLKFDIYETISLKTLIIAVMSPIAAIFSIYVLFLVAAIVYCCRPYKVSTSSSTSEKSEENRPGPSVIDNNDSKISAVPVSGVQSEGSLAEDEDSEPDTSSCQNIVRFVVEKIEASLANYNRTLYMYQRRDSLGCCGDVRWVAYLSYGRSDSQVVQCLADLSKKKTVILRQRSNLYTYNLLTVAVFYALPVFQLMYSNQSILQKTGNQDQCFFNFLCAYPQRITSTIVIGDLNHVFSNIGYLALGLLFVLWTFRRDTMHQSAVSRHPEYDLEWGIPQHYGLFYALGLALMMEGFLSGMYHVCPNETNFQFDTSFMYVIAVLCMVKLYQNRHPDINASAYTTFFILAMIIFIGMLGIMENSDAFFITFSVAHIAMCFWVSVQVYRMRPLSLGKVVKGINRESCRALLSHPRQSITPNYPSRLGLIIVGNVANWVLVYLGEALLLKRNFGSYLLNVLIMNLVLYFVFYITMKLIWREKLTLEPAVYIILSGILWICAGIFYLTRVTSWASTPAGSRHNNEVCNFLHFYDSHDIWHFLSAGSMFCTFMVLLTLDDDLVETPRNTIHVF